MKKCICLNRQQEVQLLAIQNSFAVSAYASQRLEFLDLTFMT